MAQVTTQMSFKDCKVEISTNGTTWTNISGFANSVNVDGGERQIAEFFTFDGDTAGLTSGKRSSLNVTVRAVYTEGASDVFETVRGAYENNTALYVRWSPKGGASGNFQYATSAGIVKNPPYPKGEASSPDVVMFDFTIQCASITKSAVV